MNPKKMQQVMKQMGIGQEEIDASRVIIEKEDGKMIIDNPSIIKVSMQGQDSFQISGDIRREVSNEEDIQTIVEKTGCTEEQAKKVLDKTGDLAEAILKLSE